MKNINWKIRFHRKNLTFILQLIASVAAPVLAYLGLKPGDLTTWKAVGAALVHALENPYIVTMILVSCFNAITDPTTSGISDSKKALTYTEPGK